MTAKEVAIEAINNLPEEISWQDLVEELRILHDLRLADEEIDSGVYLTNEEVKRETATWVSK